MHYTTLGETDLEVSGVTFGAWQLGGDWGRLDEAQAKRTVERALELGINTFDTAQAYGWGRSERLLGETLSEVDEAGRDELVLATKGGLRRADDGRVVRDSSPEVLREGLEASLKRLGVDVIDLYQVHWPDPHTPAHEVADAMASFKEEGLVRAIGVSNYDVDQLAAFEETASLDVLQPPYHLLRRDVEASVLPYCERNGIGVISYGTLAHGILTGKYDADTTFDEGDWRAGNPWFTGEVFETNVEIGQRLAELAEDEGATAAQLAILWVLYHPAVDSAIVGARTPEHVEGTAPAAELELSRRTFDQIHRLLDDAIGMGGATPEMA